MTVPMSPFFGARLPKTDESAASCQDAVAANARTRRFAVADGVGSSFFPAQWAALLVERFCDDGDHDNAALFDHLDWKRWLAPIQAHWQAYVRARVSDKHGWQFAHLRNSLASGEPGAATFVGLRLLPDQARWQAMIVGDSCLFRLRGDTLKSWLLAAPDEFSNVTQFFGSTSAFNICEPAFVDGDLRDDDVFVLATDALSRYILAVQRGGGAAWQALRANLVALRDADAFARLIAAAKFEGAPAMQEDDAALVVLRVGELIAETEAEPSDDLPAFLQPVAAQEPQTAAHESPGTSARPPIPVVVPDDFDELLPPPNDMASDADGLA